MASIFDERFEGAGYEESWTETLGSGCTIDEDAAISSAGSPSGWGSQCLKMAAGNSKENWIYSIFSNGAHRYNTFEFVLKDLSNLTSDGHYFIVGGGFNATLTNWCWALTVYRLNNRNWLRFIIFTDGSAETASYFKEAQTDILYRCEVLWDKTNNKFRGKINGIEVVSAALITGSVQQGAILFGCTSATYQGYEYYIDNVVIDDATTWTEGRCFDEKFEGTGYERYGWTEVVGAGCTINEDGASSDISSPYGWGSQCLKIIQAGSVANYTYSVFEDGPIRYARIEIYPTAWGLSSDGDVVVFGFGYTASLGASVFIFGAQRLSGVNTPFVGFTSNGADYTYKWGTSLSLDNKYRFEMRWDQTNDIAQAKINGSQIGTDYAITGSNQLGAIVLGDAWAQKSYTCYYDLIAIDNATWVGEELSVVVANGATVSIGGALALIQEHKLVSTDGINKSIAESISLIQEQSLEVSDSINKSVSDTANLSEEQALEAQNSLNASVSDILDLIQEHNLETTDGISLSVSEFIDLNQISTDEVSISDSISISAADIVDLGQEHNLEVTDSATSTISGSINLSEEQSLELLDVSQAAVADSIDLLQEHNLETADGVTVAAGDAADLEQEHFLEILNGISFAVGDDLNIFTEGIDLIAPEDGVSVSIGESVDLTQEHNLEAIDSIVVASGEVIDLSQEQNLETTDGAQQSVSDSADLIQEHNLIASDGVVVAVGETFTVDLEQEHNLEALDSSVQSAGDTVDLVVVGEDILSVQDSAVLAVSDDLNISEEIMLEVSDAQSTSIVDDLILLQEHLLAVTDCYNPNHVENVDLQIEHWLSISDSGVKTVGDFVNIYSLGTIIDPHLLSITSKRSISTLTPAWIIQTITTRRTIEQGDK